MTSNISSSSIISAVEGVLGSVTSALSALLFVLVLVIFMGLDGAMFGARMNRVKAGHEPVLGALANFAQGTRRYFGVATVFGGIVAVLDGIGLLLLGIPAAGLWALLAFITNYVPNVGFIIGLIPPALMGLVVGGPSKMIEVIALYCVLNLIIQSVIQPKFVGDAVGLTTTMSFLSLIVWAYLLGPLGAILAVPASLLFKAVLLDVDPDARWLQLFFGDEPAFTKKPKAKPTNNRDPHSGGRSCSSVGSGPAGRGDCSSASSIVRNTSGWKASGTALRITSRNCPMSRAIRSSIPSLRSVAASCASISAALISMNGLVSASSTTTSVSGVRSASMRSRTCSPLAKNRPDSTRTTSVRGSGCRSPPPQCNPASGLNAVAKYTASRISAKLTA